MQSGTGIEKSRHRAGIEEERSGNKVETKAEIEAETRIPNPEDTIWLFVSPQIMTQNDIE